MDVFQNNVVYLPTNVKYSYNRSWDIIIIIII